MKTVKGSIFKVNNNNRRLRLANLLIARMMDINNPHSIMDSCRRYKLKPSTFLDWVRLFDLTEKYALAREILYDLNVESLRAIAEQPIKLDPDGKLDRTDLEQKRLIIDTEKWRISHLATKYSDKMKIEHSGNVSSLADIVAQQSKVKDAN